MTNEEMITTIKEDGLQGIECKTVDEFINVLKVVQSIGSEIPGITVSIASEDDNLNKGETYADLLSGEVSHYCAKTCKGEKFINNDKIGSWANAFLIGTDGQPDRRNVNMVERNGFHVYAGEADCFGWLTGVVDTKIGKLVFG